jgi:hypothetical protein
MPQHSTSVRKGLLESNVGLVSIAGALFRREQLSARANLDGEGLEVIRIGAPVEASVCGVIFGSPYGAVKGKSQRYGRNDRGQDFRGL